MMDIALSVTPHRVLTGMLLLFDSRISQNSGSLICQRVRRSAMGRQLLAIALMCWHWHVLLAGKAAYERPPYSWDPKHKTHEDCEKCRGSIDGDKINHHQCAEQCAPFPPPSPPPCPFGVWSCAPPPKPPKPPNVIPLPPPPPRADCPGYCGAYTCDSIEYPDCVDCMDGVACENPWLSPPSPPWSLTDDWDEEGNPSADGSADRLDDRTRWGLGAPSEVPLLSSASEEDLQTDDGPEELFDENFLDRYIHTERFLPLPPPPSPGPPLQTSHSDSNPIPATNSALAANAIAANRRPLSLQGGAPGDHGGGRGGGGVGMILLLGLGVMVVGGMGLHCRRLHHSSAKGHGMVAGGMGAGGMLGAGGMGVMGSVGSCVAWGESLVESLVEWGRGVRVGRPRGVTIVPTEEVGEEEVLGEDMVYETGADRGSDQGERQPMQHYMQQPRRRGREATVAPAEEGGEEGGSSGGEGEEVREEEEDEGASGANHEANIEVAHADRNAHAKLDMD